jgi:hypothetical protein
MTAPEFNPTDPATWPLALTAEQVAAIYQRKVGGLRKSCQKGRFVPVPFSVKPYRWRKADVLRHLEGGRVVPHIQRRAS